MPVVNTLMITLCAITFFAQLQDRPHAPSLVEKFGMIPARVSKPDATIEIVVDQRVVKTPRGEMLEISKRSAIPPVIHPLFTMLTCIFLHGGWMHFIGNMWFLYIFGDNVEDRFGHVGYLCFYLGCGVTASLVHFLSDPNSTVPTIGASGAIAGVMGAYFIWYPHAKVQTLVPIFIIIQIIVLPAPLFLGIWFLLQTLQGSMSIVSMQTDGVAWWAHIGGFVAGASLATFANKIRWTRPVNTSRRMRPETVRLDRR